MADKYILIQKPVEAMQHDGTPARAYEILAWVYRNNGEGRLDEDGNLVIKASGVDSVQGNEWVIALGATGFTVMQDDAFRERYTSSQ